MTSIVLASTSIPRKLLLERLQIPFEITSPNVDETALVNEEPKNLVLRLAKEKAAAVAHRYKNSLIIGADQVGVLEGMIFGKPQTHENAIKQLMLVSGKEVWFYTGLCLLNAKNNTSQTVVVDYQVKFRTLSLLMIENYLQKENILNCAGSFSIDGLGIALVEKLTGADYTALIGLPLIQLITLLNNAGVDIL